MLELLNEAELRTLDAFEQALVDATLPPFLESGFEVWPCR
jgi:hypothetical protein